ncbi:single-stranded-DNA-specific exonuclease RecJ [Paenibacillus sabinae]|uniref:Single-stranded-DNA-specific exonuclease RecJ n=1 Tax=Paenibacillus sabinae T27 TaxID=1268072 RepID=X4ZMQ0_9BACL|nr:single-stranded-DNA-specific exonuclease RecJ [Paenibacillus sabinae]AHV98522.1 single-stranded-DNA-specific exonuclease RecJ [Paenibacillus sabinae T27]
MLHSKTQWQSPAADPVQSRELVRRLSVSPLVASLLVARGMNDPEKAHSFIEGAMEEDHDPFLLKGMKEAVPRIQKAIEEEEHILVYGDYDADGVSSTSLMIHLLRHLGASFDIYIPHRSNEGYGLHNHALDWALQQGVSLVITVDTGISACSQIAYANELGMDVIVTDHHEPPDVLPSAYALINPKLPGCPYPFKGLAGVGVAYKLAQALLDGQVPEEWLEIAAIGTVADLMPLLDENRAIVRRGLASMRRSKYPGIRALLEVSAVRVERVDAVNVAFGLAPRINASGRLDHAGRAVSLLTTEDPAEAERLAEELDLLNKERQMVVDRIVSEAIARLEDRLKDGKLPSIIVLAGEGWNVGVVGIVASKVLERYYRPVIILDINPETGNCKGSARSIPGLDIYAALSSCADMMDHFGGHPAAAGMSLHRDKLDAFAAALEEFASSVLTEEDFVPVVTADGEYTLPDLSLRAAEELELLAPFGMANPLPKFIVRGAVVKETRTMGQGNRHLKLVLQQEGVTVEAVAFGKGELAELLPPGTGVDVLAELSINEWNGSRKAQLMLQDLSVPQPQLFDFRGARDAAGRMGRLLDVLLPQTTGKQELAAAVIRKDRLHERELPEWQGMSFWVYDQYKGISPLDVLPGEGHTGNPVSLLCLLDMPESLQQLDALLQAFPDTQNIALLHSLREERDRLLIPTRDHFKTLYKWLAAIAAEPLPEQEALLRLTRQSRMSLRMLKMMLDVFEELGFIRRERGQVSFVTRPAARDLASSSHFTHLSELAEMERYFSEGSTAELQEWMEARRLGVS